MRSYLQVVTGDRRRPPNPLCRRHHRPYALPHRSTSSGLGGTGPIDSVDGHRASSPYEPALSTEPSPPCLGGVILSAACDNPDTDGSCWMLRQRSQLVGELSPQLRRSQRRLDQRPGVGGRVRHRYRPRPRVPGTARGPRQPGAAVHVLDVGRSQCDRVLHVVRRGDPGHVAHLGVDRSRRGGARAHPGPVGPLRQGR